MTQAEQSEAREVVVVSADNGERYPDWVEKVAYTAPQRVAPWQKYNTPVLLPR